MMGALVYIRIFVSWLITSANKHLSMTSGLLQVRMLPTALSAGMKIDVSGLPSYAITAPISSCSAMLSMIESSCVSAT